MSGQGHKYSASVSQNHKAQLANAYNELGKELSSTKIKVIGNYTLGRVIGEGTYGTVRLGTHRLTSTRVAIKQIPKAMSAALTREIHHHRRLHHPHVCKLYEVIATESYIWLVTELCSGGELFDYLAEKGRLSEEESRTIFGQLCLAVAYIHEKGVVHRDLKLENVLLDERCKVKLGDFGFTREFERGSLLDTYCGTTGYAAPEMLMGKKYLGPEVDIWSMGVILYCLLTGTLPFDDDDESVMREKIIIGEFDNPEWLSADARDLIHNILQQDPAKRLTISQILAHPWFSRPTEATSATSVTFPVSSNGSLPTPAETTNSAQHLPSPSTSEASFHSAPSQPAQASPITLDDSFTTADDLSFDSNTSETTVRQKHDVTEPSYRRKKSTKDKRGKLPTASEELDISKLDNTSRDASRSRDPSPVLNPLSSRSTSQSAPPPAYPPRTPARTKRRSVSSILSQPSSPVSDSHQINYPPQDFAALLRTPAPLLFSTPLERSLLNSLSALGFDIGQMVHSVLSDACDASGAIWWMLKRKAEKKALESAFRKSKEPEAQAEAETEIETELEVGPNPSPSIGLGTSVPDSPAAVDLVMKSKIDQSHSAPELTFVPPTPTAPQQQEQQRKKAASPPVTPPRSKSPRSYLSPTPTSMDSSKSSPSTPVAKDKDGSKGRSSGKPRSGSVSIVQRATMTALEAAGLVRKRSTEGVKEKEDKKREEDKDRDRREKDDKRERTSSSSDSRNGQPNGPTRLMKSPPICPVKDTPPPPSTPEHEKMVPTNLPSSPWVPVSRSSTFAAPTPANSPGNTNDFGDSKFPAALRNRSSILTTFRMWFNEDRKGKRKAAVPAPVNICTNPPSGGIPASPRGARGGGGGTSKRRGGWNGSKPRAKRASISSRRSSSANSRRSSVASMQMILEAQHHGMVDISRQRSDASRRSFTPNSEAEREFHSSRPSSIRSYSMQGRHRKSPSGGSGGSAARYGRGSTPLNKYHRRAGSSSSTRVVRQARASQSQNAANHPAHVRSNSTTSSIHSLPSSRPGSFYEASEGEGQRTGSPFRSQDDASRRSGYNTVLLAQKKHTALGVPSASSFMTSVRGSSWKKAWGTEPPGWQSRPSQFPVEVLAISPAPDQPMTIRDVFSGRQSINLGDDSDWVDEDDDFPAFAGGLGQIATNISSSLSTSAKVRQTLEPTIQLSPVPRAGGRATRRGGRGGGRGAARTRAGHSPITCTMPLPGSDGVFDGQSESSKASINEPRLSRRNLPNGRSAPAFKSAIVEEDEEEEE